MDVWDRRSSTGEKFLVLSEGVRTNEYDMLITVLQKAIAHQSLSEQEKLFVDEIIDLLS